MLVVIAGMQRSGSTFSFNIAREVLESRGGVDVFAENSLEKIGTSNSKHVVVKTHAPDPLMSGLIKRAEVPCICTIRRPEDAISSWMTAFGFDLDESINLYDQWLRWHRSMKGSVLNIGYECIEKSPLVAILKIRNYLVGGFGVFEALRLRNKYSKKAVYELSRRIDRESECAVDLGFSYYDKNTFFHRNHVSFLDSRCATECLSESQIKHIRLSLSEFVSHDGTYVW